MGAPQSTKNESLCGKEEFDDIYTGGHSLGPLSSLVNIHIKDNISGSQSLYLTSVHLIKFFLPTEWLIIAAFKEPP